MSLGILVMRLQKAVGTVVREGSSSAKVGKLFSCVDHYEPFDPVGIWSHMDSGYHRKVEIGGTSAGHIAWHRAT